MPYFLDGNNLIGLVRQTRRPTEDDRASLIRELAERLRRTRATAVLFFDGPGQRRTSLGSISIRESSGSSADDRMIAEIARSQAPQEIIVVTADRGLARRARDAGAKTQRPEDFWRRFGRDRISGEEGADSVDVDEWIQYFQDEKNREKS